MNEMPPNRVPLPTPFPVDFSFSQSSLQAYEDCPRRFWLAYVQQLPWPALEAAPALEYEQQLRWGSVFHKLVQRAETGLSIQPGELPAPLAEWWEAYTQFRPTDLDLGHKEIEFVLTATVTIPGSSSYTTSMPPAAGRKEAAVTDSHYTYRLAAKYDLVAIIEDGPIIIVDWKTGARRPRPETLQAKWQTALYPWVLVEAARSLDWGPIAPERVQLRYWFTADPEHPITYQYSTRRHEEISSRLHTTLEAIRAGVSEADFPKVPDTEANRMRYCRYCIYRSRCDRGIQAGPLDEIARESLDETVDEALMSADLDFTLDDVGELAF